MPLQDVKFTIPEAKIAIKTIAACSISRTITGTHACRSRDTYFHNWMQNCIPSLHWKKDITSINSVIVLTVYSKDTLSDQLPEMQDLELSQS